MASRESLFKRHSVDTVAEIVVDTESEPSDFTANYVLHPGKLFEDFHSKKDYA
jgi:hypothetical protein